MESPLARSISRPSPARHTPNGFRRSQTNARASPRTTSNDSPSRQLAEDLSKVYLDEDRAFRKKLDDTTEEQGRLHREAIDKALAEHEAVRQSAERVRERLEEENRLERLKRVAEEQAAVERERRRVAEEEAKVKQREIEAARQREEQVRQAAAKAKELEDAQTRIAAQEKQVADEKAKRDAQSAAAEAERKAESEKAAKEQAAKARQTPTLAPTLALSQAQRLPAQAASQINGVARPATTVQTMTTPSSTATVDPAAVQHCGPLTPTSIITPMNPREAEHSRYLDLHQRLKQMRKDVLAEAQRLGVKDKLSDKRRELTTAIGQTNKHDKTAQQTTMKRVRQIIMEGAQIVPQQVDVSPFMISVSPEELKGNSNNALGPAALLFMLSWLAKTVIRQFAAEASDDGKAADPIGVLTVTIFANGDLRFNGHSLIDILWAKYHKVCPALFGISGTQNTKAGRLRLGWDLDEPDDANYRRFRGFAVGFAAITLRDFSKSKNPNPAPNALYWTSLARILSTPPGLQSPTQYVVLQHMVQLYVERFIKFYGSGAIAALKKACVDFPATAPKLPSGNDDPAVQAMKSLPFILKKENMLTL